MNIITITIIAIVAAVLLGFATKINITNRGVHHREATPHRKPGG